LKIQKIEIYGYGKWLNQTFDQLQDLQVFYGKNEAGKSTLSSFINSIFFGFPTAHKKDQNLYIPKNGQVYGGRLFLTGTPYGDVIVERVKDRNKGQAVVTLPDGSQKTAANISQLLLGMDRETYQTLYTFKIDSLLALSKTKKEDLNRYLLSIGTSGSERLLQLADDFRQEATKLFKPTGTVPSLNKKIRDADKLQRKLQQAKVKNAEYETLLLQLTDSQKQQADIAARQQLLDRQNSDITESLTLADSYQEWSRLKKQITAVDYSKVPEDARRQWERLQEKISALILSQSSLQERLFQLGKQLAEYSHVEWYREHQAAFAALSHEVSATQTNLNQLAYLANEVSLAKAELAKQKLAMGLDLAASVPSPLEEEERKLLQQLSEKAKNNAESLLRLDQTIGFHEEKLEALQREEAKLKEEKVADAIYASWQKEIQQPPQPAPVVAQRSNGLGMGLLALAVIVLILSFAAPGIKLVAWVVAGTAAVSALLLLTKKPKTDNPVAAEKRNESGFSMEKYVRQAAVRERMGTLHSEMEELQEKFLAFLNSREEQEELGKTIHAEQQAFLQKKGYPARMTVAGLLQADPAEALADKGRTVEKQETEMAALQLAIDQWNEQTDAIREHFHLGHLTAREMADRFTEIHQAVILEENMAANVSEQIKESQAELQAVQADLTETNRARQLLLTQANAKTEADFYQLLVAKEQQASNLKRKELLDEQIVKREALLAQYADVKASKDLYEQNKAELQQLKSKLTQLQRGEVELKHQLEQLEEGGTYSALLQKFALAETELREMAVEWASLLIAGDWIEAALNLGKEDRMPTMLQDTSDYFKRLTGETYTRILFQKNGMKVQRKDGTVFLPNELSQGTVEQLYIALRLAFVKNTADIVNMPILIDDGFVNFDSERKNIMFDLLEELSGTVQIIFFTFDDSCAERFSQKQVYMLK
jgi:uncharacterized protein YhaN